MIEELEDLLSRDGIRILLLDTRHLACQTPMHVRGRLLEDVAERILHGVFINPDAGGQFVALEVGERRREGFVVSVSFLFHCRMSV